MDESVLIKDKKENCALIERRSSSSSLIIVDGIVPTMIGSRNTFVGVLFLTLLDDQVDINTIHCSIILRTLYELVLARSQFKSLKVAASTR